MWVTYHLFPPKGTNTVGVPQAAEHQQPSSCAYIIGQLVLLAPLVRFLQVASKGLRTKRVSRWLRFLATQSEFLHLVKSHLAQRVGPRLHHIVQRLQLVQHTLRSHSVSL